MLRKSSIGSELFRKCSIFVEIPKIPKTHENSKIMEGGAPALRVIRAGTRLTVHRSLPYQNRS